MQNESHVGAVNPHAECVGGDDERQIARHKRILNCRARVVLQTRVIVLGRRITNLPYEFGNFFRVAACTCIDDSCAVHVRQKFARQREFRFHIGRIQHLQIQIFAIESCHQFFRVFESEHFDNVILDAGCRCCRERERNGRIKLAARVGDT